DRKFLEIIAKMRLNTGFNESSLTTESILDTKLLWFLKFVEKRQPFQLNVLKYFAITRTGLTAVTSFLVTYQVILLQFQISNQAST
ncbi:unnamed protein product, partial [Allacma fusca]